MSAPADARARLVPPLQALVERLLERTAALRTTLRIDWPEAGWTVADPAVEALAPGATSLAGVTGINQRAAATAQWLERERRILVQDDFEDPALSPPAALIAGYGVRAQMLGPLVYRGALAGWFSVHSARRRHWREQDVAALDAAAREALALLDG